MVYFTSNWVDGSTVGCLYYSFQFVFCPHASFSWRIEHLWSTTSFMVKVEPHICSFVCILVHAFVSYIVILGHCMFLLANVVHAWCRNGSGFGRLSNLPWGLCLEQGWNI